jgi:hypothetical protein
MSYEYKQGGGTGTGLLVRENQNQNQRLSQAFSLATNANNNYCTLISVSQIHNRHFCVVWCREKRFSLDFRVQKSHEGLRRETNGRTCPLNLGPRILKIVVFGARRRLLHPHSGLGSYEIKKKIAFFNSKESYEGLRKKKNGRACPLNFGPRILKIVVFAARRRLLHPHFGL